MSESHDRPSSPSMTRIIELPDVVVRDEYANERTIVVQRPHGFDRTWVPGERPPFRDALVQHYFTGGGPASG